MRVLSVGNWCVFKCRTHASLASEKNVPSIVYRRENGVYFANVICIVSITMNEKSVMEYCVRRKPASRLGGSGMVGH